MSGNRKKERLLALVAGAAIAFNYPLLYLFGGGGNLFGWPLLVVYLFAVWLFVIVLTAVLMERRSPPSAEPPLPEVTPSPDD